MTNSFAIRTSNSRSAFRAVPRVAAFAVLAAAVGVSASCYPVDTSVNAAHAALVQVDELVYSMQEETAILQSQIDSLTLRLRKTDSLLRWLANLSGNPIQDSPAYSPTIPPP